MDLYNTFLRKNWKPNWFLHPKPEDALLEMVLIEPRNHENIPYVLANVSYMIPYAAITIIHSKSNEKLVTSVIPEGTNIRALCILPDNLTLAMYSKLLMTPDFWSKLVSPKILIFQTDTGIRNNNILDFLHVDYIGAPWTINWGEDSQQCYVGNGGFSLRNREAMINLSKNREALFFTGPEDIYFARELAKQNKYVTAPMHLAIRFSTESIYYQDSFGFHKPWEAHPRNLLQKLFDIDICLNDVAKIEKIEISDIHNHIINIDETSYQILYQWVSLGINGKGIQISNSAILPIQLPRPIHITITLNTSKQHDIYYN